MNPSTETKFNTIVNKYPSYRDEYVKGCWKWLKGRRADDSAEGLWRINDKLYDMEKYIDRHPGGREWLILAKGTDITEAFEVFHLSKKPLDILEKYYVRDAKDPRNYRLTFNPDGFFMTLKSRCLEKLKTIDVKSYDWRSKLYFDLFLAALIAFSCMSVIVENQTLKFASIILAGMFGCFITNAGHNYIHKRNSWRMYGCHAVLVNFREFRVFHAMSHHLYPNSIYDLETSIYEPFFKYMPIAKSPFRIMMNYFFIPLVYMLGFHGAFAYRSLSSIVADTQIFYLDDLIGFCLPVIMLIVGKFTAAVTLFEVFIAWNMILASASFFFSIIGLNAGHHGTEIVHEGDEFKSLDFGVYQMAATIDRYEANSNLFMILTHYGEHILHHMFPSLDHAVLHNFRDELMQTCIDFKEDLKLITLMKATIEQFKQLKRTEPNTMKEVKAD